MAVSQPLPPKQEAFVQEYLIDLNATAAYGRAGYKAKGNVAEAAASRLLRNVKVQVRIQEAMQARSVATGITAERVLQELALLGFSDIGQVLDFTGTDPHLRPCNTIPEVARRVLASVKVKRSMEGTGEWAKEVEVTEFKLWDKLAALEKLGKHLGMFAEKHEHSGTINVHHKLTADERQAALDNIAARLGNRSLPPHPERNGTAH
jgi:phage terminase small subunit